MTTMGLRSWLSVAVVLGLLAGCGSPSYTYVKNSGEKTYFKVPREWTKVDQDAMDKLLSPQNPESASAQVRRSLEWSVGFDAADTPAAAHLLESGGEQPFVFVSVTHLTRTQRDGMSLDGLRDYIFPVSPGARRAAAGNKFPLTSFELLTDKVVTGMKGIRGVHAIFNYELPDGVVQTFDETAYVNDDSSRVYFMLISCSARCHRDRTAELNKVASSFTVRS